MKKETKTLIAIIAVIAIVAIIVAVMLGGKGEEGSQEGQGGVTTSKLTITSLEDMENLVDQIYDGLGEQVYPSSVATTTVDKTDVNALKSFTGLETDEKLEMVVVSEPMMSSQAYSLVLVKVKDANDADSVAKEMSEKVNPRKWICVTAEQLYSTSSGNVVCLVMGNKEQASSIIEKFKTLAGEVGKVHELETQEDELPEDMY